MRCPTLDELPPASSGEAGWPWTRESPRRLETMPPPLAWPRISLITPSYNQGQFIEETIRSVLLQGYPNLEYIIIDGGSTDNSVEIIKKYDAWLTYWVSEPDGGQTAALNKGFARATGEIYAYLNSDDVYTPGCLQRVAEDFLKDSAPSWHAYRVQDFSEAGPLTLYYAPVISEKLRPIEQDERALALITGETRIDWNALLPWVLGRIQLHQPGVFWSDQLHKEVGGFDSRYHYGFDRKFFMQIVARNHPLRTHLGEPCARFRLHERSKSVISSKQVSGDPFSTEATEISKEFEPFLKPKDRRVAQSARAELMISDVWELYRRNSDGVACLKRLITLAADLPVALGNRFYWGTVRKMLFG